MDKILAVALKATFPGIDVTLVLDVINATPNPVVAVETLLGLYEAPTLLDKVTNSKGRVLTFVSYDKYQDRVRYRYVGERGRNMYFKTQAEADACTEFNPDKSNYNSVDFPFNKVFTVEVEESSYMSASEWIQLQ